MLFNGFVISCATPAVSMPIEAKLLGLEQLLFVGLQFVGHGVYRFYDGTKLIVGLHSVDLLKITRRYGVGQGFYFSERPQNLLRNKMAYGNRGEDYAYYGKKHNLFRAGKDVSHPYPLQMYHRLREFPKFFAFGPQFCLAFPVLIIASYNRLADRTVVVIDI